MSFEEKIRKEHEDEVKKINKDFMRHTKSNEILIIILKSHLYIERELIKTLTETIIDEKILIGTTFRQKLDLANSMGIIEGLYGALGKINSVRNSYAHDVSYEFGEKEFDDLLSTLSKEDKEDFISEYKNWKPFLYDGTIPEFNFKLQMLLSNIWFSMTSCREFAKKAIELKLQEKEIKNIIKQTKNQD